MIVMGYEIYDKKLEDLNLDIKRLNRFIINTLNPHSYVMAKSDNCFRGALKSSDILVPDGSGIVLATKFLENRDIKKIAGADVHEFLLKKADREKLRVFYMGSSWKTLNLIKYRVSFEYPNVKVGIHSPPYKSEFNSEENKEIFNIVNRFKPNILFIGMTAPKQEKWLFQNREHLNFNIGASIGAVFDFYAGTVKRPSKFWIEHHLEWLPRLINEPKRLWRRNFLSTPLFLLDIIQNNISGYGSSKRK